MDGKLQRTLPRNNYHLTVGGGAVSSFNWRAFRSRCRFRAARRAGARVPWLSELITHARAPAHRGSPPNYNSATNDP